MLRDWLINEHLLGPTGLGNPAISGFYVDDGWANTSQPIAPWMPKEGFCDHWAIGGATEEDLYCSADMGLTQADTTAITDNWRETMQQAASAIQTAGGWAWYMFTDSHAPDASGCAAYFRGEGAQLRNVALLFQWTNSSQYPLPSVAADLASFMLVRGDYAWLGYSWLGCTSDATPGHGGGPAGRYTSPDEMPELALDFGAPTAPLTEGPAGVFVRDWSKATVSMDCNTFTPSIVMK